MKYFKKLLILIPFLVLLTLQSSFYAADDTFTATVPPHPADAQVIISSQPENTLNFNQYSEVTYTIQYKLNLSYGSFPFKIVTSWGEGIMQGSGAYIDALEYTPSSASPADDGTVPIVDIANRSISWNISALKPSLGYHRLTYRLKVRTPLPTHYPVVVTTTVNATLQGVDLAPQTLDTTIDKFPVPTSAQTEPTPTPTVTPLPFSITNLYFTTITDTKAELQFSTSELSQFSLLYGTAKNNFTDSVNSSNFTTLHTADLSDLLPGTKYFFRIQTSNQTGKTISSDLFTFTTAKLNEDLQLSSGSLSLFAGKVQLDSPAYQDILLPNESSITIQLHFDHPEILTKLNAEFRRKDVLGASTATPEEDKSITFVETLPGILTSTIPIPDVKGVYDLVFNLQTKDGTYLSKNAPYNFYISNPITVLNAHDHRPVENAQVTIYRYEESYKRYSALDQALQYNNRTDYNGFIHTVLPPGKYKFVTSAVGYKSSSLEVNMLNDQHSYPIINLAPSASFGSLLQSYYQAIYNSLATSSSHLVEFAKSPNSLKATFALFIPLEILLLLAFILNRRHQPRKMKNKARWFIQFILVNLISMVNILGIFFMILFLFNQSMFYTLSFVVLMLISLYINLKLVREQWKEYSAKFTQ